MLRMLDRHAVQALVRAQVKGRDIAQQLGISLRTVRRITQEAQIADPDDAGQRRAQGVGRPAVDAAVRAQVHALLVEDPTLPPGEVWRRMRDVGSRLGLSTIYRVIAATRARIPHEIMVRFEGVAGEFAQYDFGQIDVRLTDGARRRVHFAAYRLKYSRWMHVVLVPDERVESLVRSLLASFAASGGVPLRVVFDNPRTVVTGREQGRPIWNATLAQVVIDYGFSIELCTPRSPEQKGAVENLVGFVKRAFFRARRFADIPTDLPAQLAEWLVEVNTVRACRATREPPALRLVVEQARMRALVTPPADYGLTFPVIVGPTAMVAYAGIRYAMPAEACGLPATLSLFPDRVRIVTAGGKYDATHPRVPLTGAISYLSGQRAAQLATVYGARKQTYFMRERLVELGPVGEAYMTELVHQRAHTWKGDVTRLFALLEQLGEARFRVVLQRALMQRLIGADYVERLAAPSVEVRSGEVAS